MKQHFACNVHAFAVILVSEYQYNIFTECEKKKADIIFAIDQSSSIGDDKQFRIELDFVNSLIKELDVASDQTRIGAVVFSTNSERRLELRDGINRETVIDTIQKFEYGTGDTYIGKAFADMREGFLPAKGGRPGLVPQIAVLITDGEATDQNTKAKPEADKLRNSGVEIFAIGKMLSHLSSHCHLTFQQR